MFTHRPSGVTFDNRKQAIILMGHKRYNDSLRNRDFDFGNENDNEDNS